MHVRGRFHFVQGRLNHLRDSYKAKLIYYGVTAILVSLFLVYWKFHYFLRDLKLDSKSLNRNYDFGNQLSHLEYFRNKYREDSLTTYLMIFNNPSILQKFYSENEIRIWPRRSGIKATSPIINHEKKLLMCTIPKCGSSSWRKFMLYLEFPSLTTPDGVKKHALAYPGAYRPNRTEPDPHAIAKNGVHLIASLNSSEAENLYRNRAYIKVFHVRNPVTRVLSAWLSKNRFSKDPTEFAIHHDTFPAFIKNLSAMPKELLEVADPHIRPLFVFCDLPRGAHYDIFLKFEERTQWAPLLLDFLDRTGDEYSNRDSVSQSEMEATPRRLPESLRKLALGSHWKQLGRQGADDLHVFLRHFDMETFRRVRSLYSKDISLFGYETDVSMLELALSIAATERH